MSFLHVIHTTGRDGVVFTCNNCKAQIETRYHCLTYDVSNMNFPLISSLGGVSTPFFRWDLIFLLLWHDNCLLANSDLFGVHTWLDNTVSCDKHSLFKLDITSERSEVELSEWSCSPHWLLRESRQIDTNEGKMYLGYNRYQTCKSSEISWKSSREFTGQP